jgi:regulator of RNase E activity RraA
MVTGIGPERAGLAARPHLLDLLPAASAPPPTGTCMAKLGKLGFRVLPSPPRVRAELLERFHGIASASLADAMGRFNFMDPGIQSRSGMPLCGPAVTVNCRPADNLMVHKALDVAQPGDVIVVTTCGNTANAVFGDLMCRTAAAKKLGGIVVDGAIRDVEGITRLGMPAFSRSVSPGACDKDGPGEVNVPISCGGTVVSPGDIVVGDGDGVAIVPGGHAEEVLDLVAQLLERERKRVEEIDRGVLIRQDVDQLLRERRVIE